LKEGLMKMNLKQKPVIARSHKLKDFFTHESTRYIDVESRDQMNARRLRGKSLNALSIRRESLEELGFTNHQETRRQ
jgi:gamma-glutamylcysteine synthetase